MKPIENHVAENLDTIAERDALEEKLKRVDKEVEERIKNQQKKEENLSMNFQRMLWRFMRFFWMMLSR